MVATAAVATAAMAAVSVVEEVEENTFFRSYWLLFPNALARAASSFSFTEYNGARDKDICVMYVPCIKIHTGATAKGETKE